ncbi:MAG: pantetheine-phosphate adenylyltransferase [Lactobacillus sp.]|uniref:pantetheine-phosphate adenylyltransferase n=1 Tax=Bombilactobacillus bombi TaxID=1303590 RepID=UPI000E570555|nr:pantetheine-phosphate adenylyltransferase [Bombilactobacillus bombi]AXX64619.1 pantetheine-phosphate adenylyltransferase [Bombilactobacillus bombi]MCO6542815.1 pantetheine-phosphate adenylyltransferase [Lactobacillus sp.]
MAKIGVYAGSFDPVTNGHLDIIQRASKLFDQLYVVIMNNTSKKYTFTFAEKQELLKKSLLPLNCSNVEVKTAANQLVAQVAHELGAQFLVRGLRTAADLNYEISMQQINHLQNNKLETMYLVSQPQYMYVASSMIKEVASYGGRVTDWVPEPVALALHQKLGTQS